MAFISLTPNMMVEDVKETISYYRDKLGFTLLRTIPEQGKPDWAMMKRSGVQLMFQSRKSYGSELPQMQGRKPGGGLTLYIKVQEL
ncbi:MAG: VOC family protein, partial [Flavobacteriales bacterium]